VLYGKEIYLDYDLVALPTVCLFEIVHNFSECTLLQISCARGSPKRQTFFDKMKTFQVNCSLLRASLASLKPLTLQVTSSQEKPPVLKQTAFLSCGCFSFFSRSLI
jgi:hypothetical protein